MKTILVLMAVGLWTATTEGRDPEKSPPRVLRSNRSSGELCRVEIKVEAGGELKVQHADKVDSVKMSAVAELNYDERILSYPAIEEGEWRSLRHYEKAKATLKVGQNAVQPSLREDRRLISVAVRATTNTLFSPTGPLSREELDLLNISGNGVGNSLVIDRLLPSTPVAIGDTWPLSQGAVGALLGLDAVAKSEVQTTFVSETPGVARCQMEGTVNGTSDGMPVEMEVKAKYQVDLKTKRVEWFGLLVRENREIGEVVPGTDVVLRLEMKITPIRRSQALGDAVVMAMPPEPSVAMLDLEHRSNDGNWRVRYGRPWFITADERDLTILKLMEDGQRVAQCNLSSLAAVDPAKLPSLKEFQEEVRVALGKNFGEFVEAGESPGGDDYRVYRVIVRGAVKDLPIAWHYYLVADKHGRQAAFAFTLDAASAERLAGADKRLVDQLRFSDPKVAAKPTPAK